MPSLREFGRVGFHGDYTDAAWLRGCHFCGYEFVASPKALEINAKAFHPQPNLPFGQAQIARGTGHVAIARLQNGATQNSARDYWVFLSS